MSHTFSFSCIQKVRFFYLIGGTKNKIEKKCIWLLSYDNVAASLPKSTERLQNQYTEEVMIVGETEQTGTNVTYFSSKERFFFFFVLFGTKSNEFFKSFNCYIYDFIANENTKPQVKRI